MCCNSYFCSIKHNRITFINHEKFNKKVPIFSYYARPGGPDAADKQRGAGAEA